MKTLAPNNRNPRNGLTFDEVASALRKNEAEQIRVGNNTYAEWIDYTLSDPPFIAVIYHDTKIVNLLDNDRVQLFDGGYKTISTARRMDWFLLPLGFRMIARNDKGNGRIRWGNSADQFKVYSIETGAYRDYHAGMIVQRGEF